MIVLFTVLRLLAILIVSHDMSGLLKTWKSKCWFIAGSLLLSLFVGGITGSLLALLFCYLFLNKISSSEKNSFLRIDIKLSKEQNKENGVDNRNTTC